MIDIKNATFTYAAAETPSLKNVTLHVRKGECVVLAGKSGCGKTTLTRLVNALIPHFYEGALSGEITVDGRNVAALKPHELSTTVGSVFQNPRSQFFNLDTTGEIAFGLENLGLPTETIRQAVQATAETLGIERLLEQNIFKLSGGEKQIVAFASVFALSPDIFVLDEPSSNLDTAAIAELSRLLEKLKAMGKTILVSEHRLYYLNGIADRIVLLEDGEITREWTGEAFGALRQAQREALGLRAFRWLPYARVPQSHPPAAPVLQVENLCAGYGKRKEVLRQVSLTAAAGEIVGIVGQNGEGKTTLARVLCGLHKESGGTVQIGGIALPAKKRHGQIYLVMQDSSYQLFTESVEEELRLSITDEAAPDEETVAKTLRSLSLAELAARHPQSLSGGQKQRTAIAVAAVSRAPVLIFDEPTSGLDHANMQSVVEVIKRLAAEGRAILIITHDDELLNLACGRVIRLGGKTAQAGLPGDTAQIHTA